MILIIAHTASTFVQLTKKLNQENDPLKKFYKCDNNQENGISK